jgi:carboxyl-terminal processing protease
VKKFIKYTLAALVVIFLMLGSFSGGFVAGKIAPPDLFPIPGQVLIPAGANAATPNDLQTLFAPFWESWSLVHKNYVDQPVDDTKLMQGAIRGMIASLGDPHTVYMDPMVLKSTNDMLNGNQFEGIGAWVDSTGDYLKIVSPMKNSPAEKAGLKSGDLIVGIDGKDMTGVDPEMARQKVLGPADSTVVLTIKRTGTDKPFDVSIIRAKLVVPSVESKMLDSNIAYVQINIFGATTSRELVAQLKELQAQNPKGLILDLRNNGGGYLQSAVEVASQFIKDGVIVSEKSGDGSVQKEQAISGGQALNIPLVVLVNEGTASASEILSGSIQDYGRGKLVGVTTYGKGSVQIYYPLSNDQGAASITIAKWFTPKDHQIDKIGLTPDVVVKMTEDDYKAGRDPQLDAAIQTLLEMLK